MGLKIYTGANGAILRTWWGRLTYKGKSHEKNLGVAILGEVPTDADGRIALKGKGDEAFERSRRAAQRALETWRKATRTNPAELQESAYKAHTGFSMSGVPLSMLTKKWSGLKRQHAPTAERTRITNVTFCRFAKFARKYAAERGKRCDTLNDVTSDMACAWFDSIKSQYAWGTVKDAMHLMSGAFRRWATNGQPNPFCDVLLRGNKEAGEEKKRTERKALTPEQFERLMELARADERIYPLVVCAAFTGMRLGDVCRLKVADVDLDKGEIDCVTAKAGVRVRIPLLSPELREVLERNCAVPADGGKPSPFVFPWAASQYERNRTAIVRAVKPYFARAIFGDEQPPEDVAADEAEETRSAEGKTPPGIEEAASAMRWTAAKRARVIAVYRRFKAGEPSHEIAAALSMARGQVSNYLKDAEMATGEKLRPRAARNQKPGTVDLIEKTRLARTVGKYSASLWGWHNLRHNFITCALNNGVPMYKVAAIVGHKTTAVTAGYADTQTSTRAAVPKALPVSARPSIPDMLAGLSKAQRKALLVKLMETL